MTIDQVYRESFPVGPLGCNCTIIGDRTTGKAIIVDPGGDAKVIMEKLRGQGLTLARIIHTHAHFDHFLASGELKKSLGCSLALHKADFPLWQNLEAQCSMFGMPYNPVPDPDEWLNDDEDLSFLGGMCMHTPGHSPGSMSFWFESQKLLIAGDTLFKGSVGRTDLWGGDAGTLRRSIKERIYTLDETATVVTGHGPETNIGEEMRANPFVSGLN